MIPTLLRASTALAALLALPFTAQAQTAPPMTAPPVIAGRSAPAAVALPHGVPDAVDVPYPGGPITLAIDASDVERGLYRVTETVPVAPGTRQLILQLPQWIPGNHSANGTISELVNLRFTVDGPNMQNRPVRWWRDPVEVFAFHLDLPEGAKAVVATFLDTSPLQASEGRVTMTREMLDLQWDRMSLYPAGHYVRQIRFRPQVTFPAGWQVATALDRRSDRGATIAWAEVPYDTLVDSPVYAGAWFKRFDLGHAVAMDVVADKPEQLAITPAHLGAYRALVDEALTTFGSRHFDHYDILLALSDRLGGIGLEHHRSSENSMDPRSLTFWAETDWNRNVVPHEISHSWNGKFRRPARLWTPDYRQPMQGDLLWVYEGQTQFWGLVLAARSGVQNPASVLGALATAAGGFAQSPGRDWRSLSDTTADPVTSGRRPKPWPSLARGEDYYWEGALLWLEVDQTLRRGTNGQKGLDDFARAFFGQRDGDWGEMPYELGDVVAGLNAILPFDWAGFFARRVSTPGQPAPLAGIEMGGYRLVWRTDPNPYDAGRMALGKTLSLAYSLGLTLDAAGRITACQWDSPAFNAALVTGSRIVAVNGIAYDADAMKAAITAAAKADAPPLVLIVQRGDRVQTVSIPYHGGLRYPWLEKTGTGAAGIDALLAPHRAGGKP